MSANAKKKRRNTAGHDFLRCVRACLAYTRQDRHGHIARQRKREGGGFIPQFTDEQIQAAKSIDLLAYMQTYEPGNIKKVGSDVYQLKDHDSVKISNGKWFRHSCGYGGYNALDFLIKVRGMEFKDAVQSLIDGRFAIPHDQHDNLPSKAKTPPKDPLILPPPNKNNDAVYAYLQGRGIDKSAIRRCIENGSLYESAKTHHCVFVGFDGNKSKFACVRSTNGDIKKDIKNADKRYSFVLPPKDAKSCNLAVFESPADALSHASIYEMGGKEWDAHRLSLGGVSSLALISFLERHTEINSIHLSLDNDKAGKEATDRIIKELLADKRFSYIKITVAPPPMGKDFNDTLQAIKQINKENTQNRSKADFLF